MAYRLHVSYRWWLPAGVTAIVTLIACVWIGTSVTAGKWTVVIVLALLGAGYTASRVALGRAGMETDGPVLRVRRMVGWTEVPGAEVTRVVQRLSLRGPNFRLVTTTRPNGVFVPSALMTGGQSTLFDWLLTFARQAELDPATTTTLWRLRERGLIGDQL